MCLAVPLILFVWNGLAWPDVRIEYCPKHKKYERFDGFVFALSFALTYYETFLLIVLGQRY